MRLRYGPPTDVDDDFAGIVGRTKDLHTITRSTVPLLAWWRDHAQEKLLPGVDLSTAVARFEYAVPARCRACGSSAGRGKASMTDVMVLIDDQALAIEAKHTEPKYDTVDTWLRKGKDRENRARVLGHWRHLIEGFTDAQVDHANLGSVVYQTLHRTASACAAAPRGGVAHVMYLAFVDPGSNSDYTKDLGIAARVLDPRKRMKFTVVTVPTSKGDDFSDLAELIKAEGTDEDNVELLADALVSKRDIYRFGEPTRLPIH
ncbi:MAG: hypothetical protein AB7T06_26185 [Kofleriaceae bacterium]